MKLDSTLSSVVLPAPVPPLIRQFRRALTQCAEEVEHRPRSAPGSATRSLAFSRSAGKRRIDSSGPSTASGGMIALTREPSARRASTIGELSSTRRPTPLTMRSMTRSRCLSSWNVVGSRSRHAAALDVDVLVGVDEDVVDRRVAQQRLERSEAEDLVEDVAEDRLALGEADRRVLLGRSARRAACGSRLRRARGPPRPAPRGSGG